MHWQDHITVNPLVVHGKACIRGTRIPVAVVLIQAALSYAADLAQERVLPLPA